MCGDKQNILFPKILLPFPPLADRVKTHIVTFSQSIRLIRDYFCGYDLHTQKCAAWMEVVMQLSLHFTGENCFIWKNRNNVEYLRNHSTDFHNFRQNDRIVADHLILVTDDLEHVGQGQNWQKCPFWIFLKNFIRQISLMVIGNQKNGIESEFGSSTANDHFLWFQKFGSIFRLFHVE